MKFSSARIAAIYWPSFSVGGIHTRLQNFKAAAKQTGDRFDVIRSANLITLESGRFPGPQRIRGGDVFIDIDGYAGHHPNNVKKSLKFLKENYDALFFCALVPHPNKDYGFEPQFIPIFRDLDLPKVASISDGYWSTYCDWGRLALPFVKKLYTGCEAYAIPLRAEGIVVTVCPRPFFPRPVTTKRSHEKLAVWTHQWKRVKGINYFLNVIPKISGRVELYSTGIEYFKNRTSDVWKAAIGRDHFRNGFDGEGRAVYYGWKPLEEMPDVYRRAWFSVGLQGITAREAKNSLLGDKLADPRTIYSQGSYNNSETEALYYGAVPVLHYQVLKSDLPKDCILTVSRAEEIPGLLSLREAKNFALDPAREKRARDWVTENCDPVKIYNEMKKELFA